MQRLIIILFLTVSSLAMAQPYGNEWIDYGKTYYKFPVYKEGIYRIKRDSLEIAGFPFNSIDPRNIQVFGRGMEQYIYVHGESDGTFHQSDYIEFYAKGNDGWLDSLLYENPEEMSNPYFSLFNDTIYYYVTYNTSLNNRRVALETDVDFSSYSAYTASYMMSHVVYMNPVYYYPGIGGPRYRQGEGWLDSYIDVGQSEVKNLATPNSLNGPEPTVLSFAITGASNALSMTGKNHHLRITVPANTVADTMFTGYYSVKKSRVISAPLQPVTAVSISSVNDMGVITDKMALGFISIDYPRGFDLQGATSLYFRLKDSNGSKSLLVFQNAGSGAMLLWDVSTWKRITVQYNSGNQKALVPNTGAEKEMFLTQESKVILVKGHSFKKAVYTNYAVQGLNSNYLIVTHPSLFQSANDYKAYRSATGFPAFVYNIEELYDQFGYGIPKHPQAIRGMLRFLNDTFASPPEFLFLLGKSIHSGTWSASECFRFDSANYQATLVPSCGSPSSDLLLAAGTELPVFQPSLAIGRLAATNNNEVYDYLNKVQVFESNQPAEWMKRVIHFGGGSDFSEQSQFVTYLNNYRDIISDTLFGGNVLTFLKTTSLPVQITVSDSVRSLINSGSSIITFFGHGSSSGFDQNIEDPANYANANKYPIIIANSCLAGDIHLPWPKKIAEQWVLIPNKGAIGFLASVDLGYPSYLNDFTNELYNHIAWKSYGKPIGQCILETTRQIFGFYPTSDYHINTCLDFTFHGDPALVLNGHPLPDLEINSTSLFTEPYLINNVLDSFELKIQVTNIGQATYDTFLVHLERTFPDGTTWSGDKLMYGCLFRDTLTWRLPVDAVNGPGINRFCVTVDFDNWIDEMSELNNLSCLDITINSDDLIPVYPYNFAIHPHDSVTLIASGGTGTQVNSICIFEIDTTDYFNSPLRLTTTLAHQGGVITWKPALQLTDSTVYYWRVTAVPDTGTSYNWKLSSFMYIPGKTGWAQAHHFQFEKDKYSAINFNRSPRNFEFVDAPKELRCHNIGMAGSGQFLEIKYWIDAENDYSSCGPGAAIIVVVIDSEFLVPWESDRANYGHADYPKCFSRNRANRYFVFPADSAHLEFMATMLNDSVPDGNYILAYSFIAGNFSAWPENAYQAFETLGNTQIRTLPWNHPHIFFCKKGDPGSALTLTGTHPYDTLDFSTQLPTNFEYGRIQSVNIGPSVKWNSLHWRQFSLESPTSDSVFLDVIGFNLQGDSVVVIGGLGPDSLDMYNLDQRIDAAVYPYLGLRLFTRDETDKTPAQLRQWLVTYDGVPETAINPAKGYTFYKDSIPEGENLIFGIATENISEFDMDSLLVKYWIQDRNNNVTELKMKRLGLHPGGSVMMDTLSVSTSGFPGLNKIWYEVNPVNPATHVYDQLEQYHFNNIYEKSLYVVSDIENPLLDVTFDGVRILNGDIVSAKPEIRISLKDENKYLALNDTSVFGVYLTPVSTGVEQRIFFSDPGQVLQWIPASLPDNSCQIFYRPSLGDGLYELRIQARDISGNESGSNDYRVDFEVINKPTVTHFFNYPNPFSTSTRFVFTLTGSEVPDDIRIQILTITGKLVREIRNDELGNLHIGNNITDYAWDGTDMFGDKLANGVYLYRVIVKNGGESIELRETEADQYFIQDYGKMYLLR